MLDYFFTFILVWFFSFIFHEFMHVFEHWRQTGRGSDVDMWTFHGIPSLRVIPIGDSVSRDLFLLAGGLYTSVFLSFSAVVGLIASSPPLVFSCASIGAVQFFYGFYEMSFRDSLSARSYMIGHYILYGVVLWFCVALWYLPVVL